MNNANMKSEKIIEIGQTRTIAGEEFIILDVQGDNVLCLSRNFAYKNTQFDNKSNNYANSKIRETLNTEYLKKISDVVGEENIIECEIDLTSDDGLDNYGKVTDKVGLLTADMYRKYNKIIEKYPVSDWWWLSTPWSTPHRGCMYTVRCVGYDGALSGYVCNNGVGVRPFLIFSTSIF